jgi:hypothetical protein
MHRIAHMLRRSRATVALDLGTDGLRAVVMEDGPGIRDAVFFRTPAGEQPWGDSARADLMRWVRAHGLPGASVQLVLNARVILADTAVMPAMPDAELSASVRFEAADRWNLDQASSVIRHLRLATGGSVTPPILLLATRQEQLDAAVDLTLHAGLRPTHVECAPLAAARGAVRWNPAIAEGDVAMLHLDPRVATLMVLRGGELAMFRSIEGEWGRNGPRTRHTTADGDIPLEPDQDHPAWRWTGLAEEVLLLLRNGCTRSNWPGRMVLTGPCATESELLQTLQGVCGLSVTFAGSDRWVPASQGLTDESWAAAIGCLAEAPTTVEARRAA